MNPKAIAYILTLFLLCRCNNPQAGSTPAETQQPVDSAKPNNLTEMVNAAMFDTVGVATAPVRVMLARLVTGDQSAYKSIRLTWQNVGSKKIAAIRFNWYGLNAFGEPAEMGGNKVTGFGSGFVDRSLAPGATDTGTWPIMSKDGKKVVMVWPYEIAFEDGTKWKSGK